MEKMLSQNGKKQRNYPNNKMSSSLFHMISIRMHVLAVIRHMVILSDKEKPFHLNSVCCVCGDLISLQLTVTNSISFAYTS